MAKSALLKSSIGKKYWMALTGLFLCLFLAGHLAGNLQLIFGTPLQFNQYALFMTTNPAVKLLSYLTYISILFHAIDGILLTIQNKKARPIGYAKENPSANSKFASRNMAVLGTLILVFIVMHMVHFWAKMHFSEMPVHTTTIEMMGQKQDLYVTTAGSYFPVSQVAKNLQEANTTGAQIYLDGKDFYNTQAKIKIAEGYKDLSKITIEFFKDPNTGLLFTILYVLAMAVLAFHLLHGFSSAFQSLGLNHPKYTPAIAIFGKGFAILVPLLFALIPLYIHFIK